MINLDNIKGAVLIGYHHGLGYKGEMAYELEQWFIKAIEARDFSWYLKINNALVALGYEFSVWYCYSDSEDPALTIPHDNERAVRDLFNSKVILEYDHECG